MPILHSPKHHVALLLLWGVACVWAFFGRSDLAFQVAYQALPISALVVPIVIGHLGALIYGSASKASQSSPRPHITALILLAAIAYGLCVVVLARVLEIPWRQAKFGDPVLSLGRSAAEGFFLVWLATGVTTALVLRAVPRNTKASSFGAAALAMLCAAGLTYLTVGLSSLVEWRA